MYLPRNSDKLSKGHGPMPSWTRYFRVRLPHCDAWHDDNVGDGGVPRSSMQHAATLTPRSSPPARQAGPSVTPRGKRRYSCLRNPSLTQASQGARVEVEDRRTCTLLCQTTDLTVPLHHGTRKTMHFAPCSRLLRVVCLANRSFIIYT
jgi:hypothetical protein